MNNEQLNTTNLTYRPTVSTAPTAAHYSLFTIHYSLNYSFSAKERDAETGLSYFGSRYYSSDLSVWLSVDPMSDKYPSLSPYVYCADNPVRCVDPNGEEIVISEMTDQNNNQVFKIKFTAALIDRTGYIGEGSSISDEKMNVYKAVIEQSIKKTYGGTKEDGTIVDVEVDIAIYSKDDLSYECDNRHAINIVNFCSDDAHHGGESPIGGSYMEIRADVCQNNNGIQRSTWINTLERTSAHEFGHLLGLDHSTNRDNIMYENPGCGNVVTGAQIRESYSIYKKQGLNCGCELLRTAGRRGRGMYCL